MWLSSSAKSGRGFVLFVVLVMVAVVSAFLFSLYTLSQKSYSRAVWLKDYATAYHAAVSAVKIALSFLREDKNGFDGEGDDWARPIVYSYRGIAISIRIEDECGKLNINTITKERYYSIHSRLLEELEVEPLVADAIKDWIDRDSEPMPNGAEEDYYAQFGYRPSNENLKSLEELFYVKGISKTLFKRLKPYLTVHSAGKINVNSAPKKLLLALSEDMSEEAADSIIEARPIKELPKIRELPAMSDELYYEIKPLITNRCDYFRISAVASFGEATAEVEAYTSRKKVLEWKVLR
jgi:general secretion pathway protein K